MAKDNNHFNDEDLNPDEEIRLDNQIKRLELEMSGAKFIEMNPDGIELPPEIEAQMLDQILAFEKVKKTAKEVSLYEFLKKPKFSPIEELDSEDIILEKERLLKLFSKRGIVLTSIMPVSDKDMYRFMTTEFMEIPMLDLKIKGFVRHFIYEEFFPNEELNIMQLIHAFLETYFKDSEERTLDTILTPEILEEMVRFKSLYDRFELKYAEGFEKTIKKIKAQVKLKITWEAYLSNSLKSHQYDGVMILDFTKRKGEWKIKKVVLPSIKQ